MIGNLATFIKVIIYNILGRDESVKNYLCLKAEKPNNIYPAVMPMI